MSALSARSAAAMVLAAVLAAGCAAPPPVPTLRVILLPQKDAQGQPIRTAVNVSTGSEAMVLDQPLATAEFDPKGKLAQRVATLDEVQARYGNVLKIQPASPETFVLGFVTGKSQLTPESEAQLPKLVEQAKRRPGGEILVIGHTDRVGSVEANDKLSQQRADAIAALLRAEGLPAELVTAIGKGERQPLVPTEDEVAEPRNRRAEIIIR